jgi:hypothetical protein
MSTTVAASTASRGTPPQLGRAVLAELTNVAADSPDLGQALKNAITRVADRHSDTCNLVHPGTPGGTVGIAHIGTEVLSYLELADSTLVVETAQGIQVVTDQREASVGATLRTTMDQLAGGTEAHDAARRDYVAALRAHRNVAGGFWVAAADTAAADEAIVGSVPRDQVDTVALLTDGATRIVDRFGLASWPDVLRTLLAGGPAELIRQNRDAERSDPRCERWPRGKVYDDATAAIAILQHRHANT